MKRLAAIAIMVTFSALAWAQGPASGPVAIDRNEAEMVFSKEQGGWKKRIPAVLVTPQGAFLAATEHRPSTSDGSLTGIFLARKVQGGEWEYDLETLAYNAGGWGKFMNPSFTIDEKGAHGPAGRIFLFFLAMDTPTGLAPNATATQMASCYVYSDDDGRTWSEIARVPHGSWGDTYEWMVPSPANGIQLEDGTLMIPCMGRGSGHWYSAILYKRPGEDWRYSKATEEDEDNESICYLGSDGEVYLNCRNEANGHVRNLYRFDVSSNSLVKVDNPFDPNIICQGTICKASSEGRDFYLMSLCDPTEYNRRNRITVWVSPDALHWTKAVRITDESGSAGYSAIDFRDGKCGVVWEDDSTIETIGFTDLTPFVPVFLKCID